MSINRGASKSPFFANHLRSLGLPLFLNAICMNNNLKYIFFIIMQHSGFAGQKIKLRYTSHAQIVVMVIKHFGSVYVDKTGTYFKDRCSKLT